MHGFLEERVSELQCNEDLRLHPVKKLWEVGLLLRWGRMWKGLEKEKSTLKFSLKSWFIGCKLEWGFLRDKCEIVEGARSLRAFNDELRKLN